MVTIQTFPALFDALDKYPKLAALNDLFGAEVTDENKLAFSNRMATRLSQDEEVMAQLHRHIPDQVMHGVFPTRILDVVLDAPMDNEKLSLQVLDSKLKSNAFAVLILKMLSQNVHTKLV